MEINNEDQDEVEAVSQRRYINRERDVAEERLMADYFGPHPKYPAEYFRRRYRMKRELFLEIVQGMLGSIDCMHWEWVNCPKQHCHMSRGDKKNPTIILKQLHQTLSGFGMPFRVAVPMNENYCSHQSPLFELSLLWYLPSRGSTFVKSFTVARDEKNAVFKRRQESARKDVERAFGVLQGRWRIIAQPARAWTVNKLRRIMYTCIILHNMILKNQRMRSFEAVEIYTCQQQNIIKDMVERCAIRQRKAKELRDITNTFKAST
ncbi:ALP1-like protein [Tanacetum coccineum]